MPVAKPKSSAAAAIITKIKPTLVAAVTRIPGQGQVSQSSNAKVEKKVSKIVASPEPGTLKEQPLVLTKASNKKGP
jgi:hypothetical protein